MKFINPRGIPEPLARAIRAYWKGRTVTEGYSMTELWSPPQMVILKRKYWDVLEIDVGDLVQSFLGNCVHDSIYRERNTQKRNHLHELTLEAEIDGPYGRVKVTGHPDFYDIDPRVLLMDDFKTTKAYKWIKRDEDPQYRNQLQGYGALAKLAGYPYPQRLRNVLMIKDWSDADRKKRPAEYPDHDVQYIEHEVPRFEDALAAIADRVFLHETARMVAPPSCTEDETWQRGGQFAVKKSQAGRAVNGGLYGTDQRAEAEAHAVEVKGFVEYREVERPRCFRWCDVKAHCTQYKEFLLAQEQLKKELQIV